MFAWGLGQSGLWLVHVVVYACAYVDPVFSSQSYDISIRISTRWTNLSVFLVFMLMLMSTQFSLTYIRASAFAYALVKTRLYRAFSLTLPASMRLFWNKREKKSSTPTGLVWGTSMVAVSLFWNTNMASVMSCVNTLLKCFLWYCNCALINRIKWNNNRLLKNKQCLILHMRMRKKIANILRVLDLFPFPFLYLFKPISYGNYDVFLHKESAFQKKINAKRNNCHITQTVSLSLYYLMNMRIHVLCYGVGSVLLR